MPRFLRFRSLLLLFLLALSLSCTARSPSEAVEPADEPAPVVPPPFRIVLASPREAVGHDGLPEGMVTILKLGTGRLSVSSSTWKAIVGLAEDVAVRAVVVADAPQGTAALFTELKELRPDLMLLAVAPVESPLVIQASADIILDFDPVIAAYSATLIATRMGRSSMLSLTMPGMNDDWRLNTRQAVLRMASRDMGIDFKSLSVAPDNLEKEWRALGLAAGAAIVVNDSMLAYEALRLAEASGALFIELDRPENGYPGTNSDVKLTASLAGDDLVRSLIDSARSVPGQPGLTLVWPGEQASLLELGALAFARAILDDKPANEASLAVAMNTIWPAGQWHASYYVDSQSGVRARNHFLTSADPYLVGRSYLSSESGSLPSKYRLASW